MRKAMAEAEVGDEQRFEDPTVNALCERVAELLGFEAAVFLPVRDDVQRDRASGCTSGRAATRRSCTAPRTRSSPRPAARRRSRAR